MISQDRPTWSRWKLGLRLASLLAGLLLTLLTAVPAAAADPIVSPLQMRPDRPARVCPERFLLRHPGLCSPSTRAAKQLLALARQGLYPGAPLPTESVDPDLTYLPFDYLKASDGSAYVYSSIEAAERGSGGRSTGKGFVYVSYYDEYETSAGKVYRSEDGFVRGDDVSRVTPANFRGLAFSRTPDRAFGWTTSGGVCPKRSAGALEDLPGPCYARYQVLQIYDQQSIDGQPWYRIGAQGWIEGSLLALVEPDPTPPEGVEDDRWISINLEQQTVMAYEGGELVYATLASTGRYGFWTQPGLFQVWIKLERDNMTGGLPGDEDSFYFLENIPWVMYFDQARAFHGTYWHNKFGTPTSRGCANLTMADARWIFDFAEVGTSVYVWDPSGETPTDPSLYGAGGA